MTIPDYQEIMLPLLQRLRDGEEVSLRTLRDAMEQHFGLSHEERTALIPSGQQTVITNRVGWAKTHLVKALLVDQPRRGYAKITERGLGVLSRGLHKLDRRMLLEEFAEFRAFVAPKSNGGKAPSGTMPIDPGVEETRTPQEIIADQMQQLSTLLQSDVLERLASVPPGEFEKLVVDLLVAMGYGGTHEAAARVVGKSGDGGIDGVIDEDRLGFNKIYVQAKRWSSDVGERQLRDFVGGMDAAKGATRGVFITTSGYTQSALAYAERVNKSLVLIDGRRLAELMIEHNVGVTLDTVYTLKRIDENVFDELG